MKQTSGDTPLRSERWWWLGGFLLLSLIIHLLLALSGPGRKLGRTPAAATIELTLLPPEPKPPMPKATPKAVPTPKATPTPKTVSQPDPKPTPKMAARLRTARAAPKASAKASAKTAQKAPLTRTPLPPLPDDTPDTPAAPPTETPHSTRVASARTGVSGGASSSGRSAVPAPQTPAEMPTSRTQAGSRAIKMATRLGGPSVLSVNNPLAEDAVPDETPGGGAGAASGGPAGKMTSLSGTGKGRGSGSGLAGGHGTGAGKAGSGAGVGLDLPGAGGVGFSRGSGRGGGHHTFLSSTLPGGSALGGVGDLLRGEPARTPGDGRPGTHGHGLSAQIFEGRPYLSRQTHQRTDAVIDFNWGTDAAIIHGVSRLFSVRWTGFIQPKTTEDYTFVSLEDDGLRVWIDNKLVIDDWNEHKPAARRSSLPLKAGRKYPVKIEYFENGLGHAEVHLRWTSPSQTLQIVPESAWLQE